MKLRKWLGIVFFTVVATAGISYIVLFVLPKLITVLLVEAHGG